MAVLSQSGAGKTTLCRALVRQSNFDHFDTKETKHNLINSVLAPFFQSLGYEPNTWLPSHLERLVMRASYVLNHTLTGLYLENGKPVIVSTTYSHPSYQAMLKEIPEISDKSLVIISLHTNEQTLNQQISSRPTDPNNISAFTDIATTKQLRSSYLQMTGHEVYNFESTQTPSHLAKQVISILTTQDLIPSEDN